MNRLASDWRHADDVRRHEEALDFDPTAPGVDRRVSPNVGELMAVAMAAAGMSTCDFAGRVPCETDYLAISGAKFPETVTAEQMERFNHATRFLPDDVSSAVRYEAMSAFWHLETFDARIAEIERRTA